MKSIFPEGTQIVIYKFRKVATQSGLSKAKNWRIKFENPQLAAKGYTFDLMQWSGGFSTLNQVALKNFESLEGALNYAKSTGLPYEVMNEEEGEKKKFFPKSYASNFC